MITAARTALEAEEVAVAAAVEAHGRSLEAVRDAALEYAAEPSPAALAAHRSAKDAAGLEAQLVEAAKRRRDGAAAHLERLLAEQRRVAEEEAAEEARRVAEESAAQAAAQRARETAADRAHLAVLSDQLGRSAFATAIRPEVARIEAARRELEAAVAAMLEKGEAQEAIAREAAALALEIDAPAPPAAVGRAAPAIAIVLVRMALRDAYAAEPAPRDLGPWIAPPPTRAALEALRHDPGLAEPPSLDAFEAWAVRALGFEYTRRANVSAEETLEALLVHGVDVMAEEEQARAEARKLARMAEQTTAEVDPVTRAHLAMAELGFSALRGRISLGRGATLQRWIAEGIAAVRARLASAPKIGDQTAARELGLEGPFPTPEEQAARAWLAAHRSEAA